MSVIRSPLGRARGHGLLQARGRPLHRPAGHGDGAAAAGALGRWPRPSRLAHGDYELGRRLAALAAERGAGLLLAFAAFWHMQLGMRTIIEDYFAEGRDQGRRSWC